MLTTLTVAGLTAAFPARADISFYTGIEGGNQDALTSGTFTIQVTEGDGTVADSGALALGEHGSNWFTTVSVLSQDIKAPEIHSEIHVYKVKQVRLGGESVPVPEPSAIILLGISFLGVAVSQRSRWSKRL